MSSAETAINPLSMPRSNMYIIGLLSTDFVNLSSVRFSDASFFARMFDPVARRRAASGVSGAADASSADTDAVMTINKFFFMFDYM